jgi:hypothetical protein
VSERYDLPVVVKVYTLCTAHGPGRDSSQHTLRIEGLRGLCSCGAEVFDFAGAEMAGAIALQKWAREEFERHTGRSVTMDEVIGRKK